jgi:hypothetical protein
MVTFFIDGEWYHQDSVAIDLALPIIRDSDGAQAWVNLGKLAWWGPEGILPGDEVSYRTVSGPTGARVIEINDSITGYAGPAAAVATTSKIYAIVIRNKEGK